MQLSKETIQYLKCVIKVAKILRIENLVLDNECVRGNLQQEGSMIIHREGIPKFEFNSLAIAGLSDKSRINTLGTRLALLGDDITIEALEREGVQNSCVVKLVMANSKTEVEFKCADPTKIEKAPKLLKDPVFFTFSISADEIALLSRAESAMAGVNLTFKGSKKGVATKICDPEGDMMTYRFDSALTYAPECEHENFSFAYKNKILMPLLKECSSKDSVEINITRRGFLRLAIHGITVYITTEI